MRIVQYLALISFLVLLALPASADGELPPLEEGLTSFGGAVAGDVLYV